LNRADLHQLADLRIAEARALLQLPVPMPDGAYYLAGYAVECALKACIAKSVHQHDWPEKKFVVDCHTHSIHALLRLAALETTLAIDGATNPALGLNWTFVKDWDEHSRYQRHTQVKAQRVIDAVSDVANGVLPWIKAHW